MRKLVCIDKNDNDNNDNDNYVLLFFLLHVFFLLFMNLSLLRHFNINYFCSLLPQKLSLLSIYGGTDVHTRCTTAGTHILTAVNGGFQKFRSQKQHNVRYRTRAL